ncbi:MAG TPA: HNH endonuclease signature motif containing protein [Xanthobacteraceae bacterium]|nr:HNH endonuclease signature motif containing protein [Xanthobacteraceae bacterium]
MSRREFSSPVKRAALERSGGTCECYRIPGRPGCGALLGPGNTFYEHIIPDQLGGEPSLDNCAALTKTCWRLKTDTYDLPVIAKSKRVRDRHRGIKPQHYRALPGSKRSGIKIPFGRGPPIDRRTGQPVKF